MLTSRGIHLVLKQTLCPEGVGLLLPSTDDGRVLFMLPFFGRTLVGTTDTPCPQEQASVPAENEVKYLLDYVQRWFPARDPVDVGSCWAGGRPLLKPAGADVNSSRVVREHEVETLACGLVSVMGGKWTTCRPMAIDTLQAVEQQLGHTLKAPGALPLIGSAPDPLQTPALLQTQHASLESLLPDTPQRSQQIAHLQANHGLAAAQWVSSWSNDDRQPLSEVIPVCRGELRHAITHEHARGVTDVLCRRTRLGMVDQQDAERLRPNVSELLAQAGHGGADAEALDLSR